MQKEAITQADWKLRKDKIKRDSYWALTTKSTDQIGRFKCETEADIIEINKLLRKSKNLTY